MPVDNPSPIPRRGCRPLVRSDGASTSAESGDCIGEPCRRRSPRRPSSCCRRCRADRPRHRTGTPCRGRQTPAPGVNVASNLAYRWFCKLGIEDGIPDHSVFSRARHERFRQSDALRRVFERVVAKCIAAGLVGGEGFSIDASLIRADAGKKKRAPGDQPIAWPRAEEASRAVREYLAALDEARNDEESGGDDDGLSGGGNRRKPPKRSR